MGRASVKFAFALFILLCGSIVSAHHGTSAYDRAKPVTLEGKVTKMEWINPHAFMYVDVKGSDGKVENWAIECGAPNALIRRGVTKESVPEGLPVVVKGYKAKDGTNTAIVTSVALSDGRLLFGDTSPDSRGDQQH